MRLRINFLFFLLWSFSFVAVAQTKNGVSGDRQALMDLYAATGGDSWTNKSGWGNGDPSGSWYGVEVDANGRVVRLDLWENGLQGQLPASIGNLTKLIYLNVKQNQLTGTIPSEIGNMASLEWLILSGNSSFKEPPQDLNSAYHPGKGDRATNDFTGAIPSTIGNLTNLKRFELSGSSITSIPDELFTITSLEGIYMNMNYNLSGSALSYDIGNLTNIQHLYMCCNEFEGELPASLSKLTKLTYVSLGEISNSLPNNNFTGSLPDFSRATNLRSIILDKNDLSGDWPHYWNNGSFDKLNTLRASWNEFTGTMHDFDNLPLMRSFSITGNNMEGSVDWLTTIDRGVIIIAAGWNNFSGEFPQNWGDEYWDLRLFRLNDTRVSGHIPCDFWDSVNGSDKLKWIYLQDNELDSNATSCMEEVDSPVLQTINVGGNNF